jgi:hypothetical protein
MFDPQDRSGSAMMGVAAQAGLALAATNINIRYDALSF